MFFVVHFPKYNLERGTVKRSHSNTYCLIRFRNALGVHAKTCPHPPDERNLGVLYHLPELLSKKIMQPLLSSSTDAAASRKGSEGISCWPTQTHSSSGYGDTRFTTCSNPGLHSPPSQCSLYRVMGLGPSVVPLNVAAQNSARLSTTNNTSGLLTEDHTCVVVPISYGRWNIFIYLKNIYLYSN